MSGLFHVNGNSFYSIIDVYDEYLLTMMKTYNANLYEHLQTKLFTKMTGVPYCSQSHDARHKEADKRAQNMFPGNSLDELDLAFTIVDDIWQLRKEKFSDFGVVDSATKQAVVPNLDSLIIKMRYALRKSQYLEKPTMKTEAKSISDKELHPALNTLFQNAHQQRQADILNVMRYNDFSEAFGGANARIPIFKDDSFNESSVLELKTQIHILILAIEDLDIQIMVRHAFDKVQERIDAADFHEFISDLLDKNYYKLCEVLK